MLKGIRIFFILCVFSLILGSIQLITNNPFSRKNTNELNVFIWSDMLDVEMIDEFEEKTGIKVHLHFFNSNEELLTKLEITKGEGYDVLFPSDYACKILYNKGYLKEIDKSKIDFFHNIFPFLLNKSHDPNNIYSIPYMWESYGFAYDPSVVDKELYIRDLYKTSHPIATTPDPIETVTLAAYHLYGDKQSLTKEEILEITKLLKTQKQNVEAYADFRAKDLITSNNIPLTLIKTSYIDGIKKENPKIRFSLPKDKIFTTIESAVINKKCGNIDNVYTFLNYIYKPEMLATSVDQFPLYPSCPEALDYSLDHHTLYIETIYKIRKRQKDILFFRHVTDSDTIRKIFIETKA